MNSNVGFNTFTGIIHSKPDQLYYTRKIVAGVVKLSHYRNSTSSASKTFNWCSQCSKCSKVFQGMGRGLHVMTDHETDHGKTHPVLYPKTLYYIYYINYIRGSTASQKPWNSASSKLYYIRGRFPRVVKLVWLTVCIPSINSNVKLNTFTRIEQSPENQLYRPWKISTGSVKLSYRENPWVLRRGSSTGSVKSVKSVGLFKV